VRVFGEVAQVQAIDEVLTAAAVDEIRRLAHPPTPVRRTLEVVHLLLHAPRYCRGVPREGVRWERVQRTVCAEDFMQRLHDFDIDCLKQTPHLARDLHALYFKAADDAELPESTKPQRFASKGGEALSPDRVRRASTTVATLFSWAARNVRAAAPEPLVEAEEEPEPAPRAPAAESPEPAPAPEPPAEAVQQAEAEAEAPPRSVQRLTVGVWLACARGHGLEVGCVGPTPTCDVCGATITRGGDSAACRECHFFVCVECRKGGWLALSLAEAADGGGDAGPAAAPPPAVEFDVVGFRWLRRGEELPAPLSLPEALERGAVARWGRDGQVLEGCVRLELRANLQARGTGDAEGRAPLACEVDTTRGQGRGTSGGAARSSGVFGLTDARGLGAAVLLGLCGVPGR